MNNTNDVNNPLWDGESLDSLAKLASARFEWHWEDTAIAGEMRRLAVASDPEGMLIDACVNAKMLVKRV